MTAYSVILEIVTNNGISVQRTCTSTVNVNIIRMARCPLL